MSPEDKRGSGQTELRRSNLQRLFLHPC